MKNIILSGADTFVKTLLENKVKYVFGYPGGAIMPIYDALYRLKENICHILTRHEQGAIHAAQGYARVSGSVGVCLATSGPGATNLITGLADSFMDSTPLVCITGQVYSHLLGTDAFQETDIIDISLPVTKWNAQVKIAEDLVITLQKAFYIASSGRPGPVLIDLTKDAQLQKVIVDNNQKLKDDFCTILEYDKIAEAANLINKAKRPLVLAGNGVVIANSEDELKLLIEKACIPVATTLLGRDIFESNHPLFIGMLGMHGNYAPNILTNKCDVMIAVGLRFDDRVTGDVTRYARQAKIIHLEIDPSEIGKNITCDVTVLGDCKSTLPILTKNIIKNYHTEWVAYFSKVKKQEYNIINNDLYPKMDSITMGEVIRFINLYKDNEAVLVTDVGQHQMVASRYLNFSSTRSYITSGGLGTMGFSIPASIGAQYGAKNRPIICIVGDGSLQMTIQELGTILQCKLPIKIVLLNNNYLGMVRQWQELFFEGRYAFTEMINPDFVAIAAAYNIKGKKVSKRENLEPSIREMFIYENSFLLEVIVNKEDKVLPMIPPGSAVDDIILA